MASIWRLNDQNIWVTSQNYESDQIIVHCIDFTSKRSKKLSYVPKLQSNQITMDCIDLTSKQSKMLRFVAKHSKPTQTNESDQIINALHRFDV